MFPAARRPSQALERGVLYKLWASLRKISEEPLPRGLAFHALRRKFATDLCRLPSAIVAAAGGWLNPEVVVKIYSRPNVEQVRDGIESVRSRGS